GPGSDPAPGSPIAAPKGDPPQMPTLSRNLIISFVLAVAAAGALFAYTSQVRKSAESSADTVTVIVATHEVPVGTTVDDARSQGYLSYHPVRQPDVADGASTRFAPMPGQVGA